MSRTACLWSSHYNFYQDDDQGFLFSSRHGYLHNQFSPDRIRNYSTRIYIYHDTPRYTLVRTKTSNTKFWLTAFCPRFGLGYVFTSLKTAQTFPSAVLLNLFDWIEIMITFWFPSLYLIYVGNNTPLLPVTTYVNDCFRSWIISTPWLCRCSVVFTICYLVTDAMHRTDCWVV